MSRSYPANAAWNFFFFFYAANTDIDYSSFYLKLTITGYKHKQAYYDALDGQHVCALNSCKFTKVQGSVWNTCNIRRTFSFDQEHAAEVWLQLEGRKYQFSRGSKTIVVQIKSNTQGLEIIIQEKAITN